MPEDMSEYMPEDMPDRMPDRMPEDMSDRMPEDMPDKMPEDLPDRMPEDMPEHMPEDMPDRMPNRMPEDMSDRMPQDLPVRKCINVMVGITRSKVISNLFHKKERLQSFLETSGDCAVFSNQLARPIHERPPHIKAWTWLQSKTYMGNITPDIGHFVDQCLNVDDCQWRVVNVYVSSVKIDRTWSNKIEQPRHSPGKITTVENDPVHAIIVWVLNTNLCVEDSWLHCSWRSPRSWKTLLGSAWTSSDYFWPRFLNSWLLLIQLHHWYIMDFRITIRFAKATNILAFAGVSHKVKVHSLGKTVDEVCFVLSTHAGLRLNSYSDQQWPTTTSMHCVCKRKRWWWFGAKKIVEGCCQSFLTFWNLIPHSGWYYAQRWSKVLIGHSLSLLPRLAANMNERFGGVRGSDEKGMYSRMM